MTRWEYKRTPLMSDFEMNKLGEDSWELVTALQPIHGMHTHDTAPGAVLFWKRPVK